MVTHSRCSNARLEARCSAELDGADSRYPCKIRLFRVNACPVGKFDDVLRLGCKCQQRDDPSTRRVVSSDASTHGVTKAVFDGDEIATDPERFQLLLIHVIQPPNVPR
jgi:hypothetical protein